MDGEQRFWAFLSYSHADRDRANWLHRALETYVLPRRLIGRQTPAGPAPRRLRPIFKDRDDLAADADLRGKVETALAASSALIVVCSPAAARSPWVEEEIVRFRSLRGEDRVFAVIASGEPNASRLPGRGDEECFPPPLRFTGTAGSATGGARAEFIAADLRPGADGPRLARMKLIAGILGLDLDDLVHRDAQRRGRQLIGLSAASLAGAAAMGALAVAALVSRNEARDQRAQAEGLIEFMLGDLRKQLEPTGRLDVLDKVGAKAMAYYAAEARHGMDDDALGRRARVLHMLGEISDERGDLAGAQNDFANAFAVTSALLARRPDDTTRIFNHAQSAYYVGYIADRRGDEARAERQFLLYKQLADRLVALDPARATSRMEVGYANSALGALLLKSGRADEAVAAFSTALAVSSRAAADEPADRDRQDALAQSYAWLADAEVGRGRLAAAMADRQSERAIYQRMLALQRGDTAAKEALVVNGVATGRLLGMLGRTGEAVAQLRQSAAASEALMASGPDNTDYQEQAAFAFAALARALLATHSPAAGPAADRDMALATALVRRDASVELWRGVLLGEARVIEIKIAANRALGRAARAQALAPAVTEAQRLAPLHRAAPANVALARIASEASLLAGDDYALAGKPDRARAQWRQAAGIAQGAGLAAPSRGQDRGHLVWVRADDRLSQTFTGGEKRPRSERGGRAIFFASNEDYSW